jgi:hypothetical protein
VTADHEIVSGDVKFVPDAGDRGLGTATAANAEQDAPRIRITASIRLTARVFMGVSSGFKGDGRSFGPDGMIQPINPD